MSLSSIYRALLLKHLKDYDDPHQTGIEEVKDELAVQELSRTLYNSLDYPFNNSKDTMPLIPARNTLDYTVETSLDFAAGNVGEIIISDKQLNGFKVEFTGSASSVVVRCKVRGGMLTDLPPLGTELDACTWQQISDISKAGLAANYFAVGDCKAVHLQGTIGTLDIDETYYVFILGFNHNSAIEGRGISFGCFKTAKTGGVDVALIDSHYNQSSIDGTKYFNVNHSGNTTVGGWQGCDLRYDILGSVNTKNAQNASSDTPINPVADTLMAALPLDLRVVMKPITKYTDNYGNGNNNDPAKVTVTIDYLPLLAEYEISGIRTQANSGEQTYQRQYEYFENGGSLVKYNTGATAVDWWERSAHYSGRTGFCSVLSNGMLGNHSVGIPFGISPIFLI